MSGQFSSFSLRNIEGSYFWSLEETQQASWVPMISNMFDSDQPYEIYKWLGSAPSMSAWRGERVRSGLGDYELNVISDKFDSTLAFDVDDIRRDKTGQIVRRVAEMGQKAATLPQRLFTTLLEANGTGYDGAAFFANAHNAGSVDNNLAYNSTVANAPTSAEMSAAILEAVQAMYGFKDDSGDPCNEFAQQFMVMVPVNMWQPLIAALKDVFTSAGVSNTLQSAAGMGLTITPVVNPRLTADTKMYMFRTDAPVKAGIWQEEMLPGGEAFKTLGIDSDNAFWREEVAFGAKRICQAALGRFELATLTTFS